MSILLRACMILDNGDMCVRIIAKSRVERASIEIKKAPFSFAKNGPTPFCVVSAPAFQTKASEEEATQLEELEEERRVDTRGEKASCPRLASPCGFA